MLSSPVLPTATSTTDRPRLLSVGRWMAGLSKKNIIKFGLGPLVGSETIVQLHNKCLGKRRKGRWGLGGLILQRVAITAVSVDLARNKAQTFRVRQYL